MDSTRLLYGSPADASAPRQVDQCLSFYQEVDVAEVFGVQFILQLVINCIDPVGLAAFGFSVDDERQAASPLFVAGQLAFSSDISALLNLPPDGLELPLRHLVPLVDSPQTGQLEVAEQDPIYTGAARLIEFVEFDSAEELGHEGERVLTEIGITEEFDRYITATHCGPRDYVAPGWLAERLEQYKERYRASYFDGRKVLQMVKVFCPLVCIDGPLCEVSIDAEGDIDRVTPTDILLTGVRSGGWPHSLRKVAPTIDPEAVVIVANRTGLRQLLPVLHCWFQNASNAFAQTSADEAKTLLLEAGFLAWVRGYSKDATGPYRSDLISVT